MGRQLSATFPSAATRANSVPQFVAGTLAVHSSGRYLTRNGTPLLLNGDTPWMLVNQCTDAQITSYLETRESQGFNAILVEAPGAFFTTQSPLYDNIDGEQPFTSTSYTAASFESLVEAYWQRVDHMVDEAARLGIVVLFCPAYLGFGGGAGVSGDQGWDFQVNAATNGNLQTYGATLATRYQQGNIIWVMGGDFTPSNPEKCWNIATGIRSVDSSALITWHGGRTSPAYASANGLTGFNVNNIYSDGVEYTYAATEYARSPVLPFFFIEGWYEGDGQLTDQGYRRQAYASVLSGALGGHILGVSELWGFGGYGSSGNAATALANHMTTTVALDMQHFAALFGAYSWWLLEPKTDTSLITTSLGSGTSRIIGARASDGSVAMIYTGSAQSFTVNMTALSASSVRAREFNPTDGSYSTYSGSPFSNTGTRAFTSSGERVLVLDAAP